MTGPGVLYYEGGEVTEELKGKITFARFGPQVTYISNGDAFSGCKKLVGVRLNEGLRVIGEGAFENCSALRSVTLPSTVTELDYMAFRGCGALVEVQLNEGLQIIGAHAFRGCTSLRSMTLPSTVTRLGQHAFGDCRNLSKVQLNEGLHVIGEYAFVECNALRSVTMPSTVNDLGHRAFKGCSDLAKVTLLGGERLISKDFLVSGAFSEEQGLLNQGKIDGILFDESKDFAFRDCPFLIVQTSISSVLSERMARLLPECRLSVEERIRYTPRLGLMQDGNQI